MRIATVSFCIVILFAIVVACGEGDNESPATLEPSTGTSETPAAAASSSGVVIREHRVIQEALWFPFYKSAETMFGAYPLTVIASVEEVVVPFDPRPGLLGRSDIAEFMTDPKDEAYPQEILDRPPGNLTSLYAVRVTDVLQGKGLGVAPNDVVYVHQPGGVYEGVAYETGGDPVIEVGASYVFFLETSTLFEKEFSPNYTGPPFGRFLLADGVLEPVSDRWGSDCPDCALGTILNQRPIDEVKSVLDAAAAGLEVEPVETAAGGEHPEGGSSLLSSLPAVAIDANPRVSPANAGNSLGSRETCRSTGSVLFTKTTTGGNDADTLNDTSVNFPVDIFKNWAIKVNSGNGAGQIRRIAGNLSNQFLVTPGWTVVPDASSSYSVLRTVFIDLTVQDVPSFDPESYTQGISGFGATIGFNSTRVAVVGANPGGETDLLLAAGGARSAFDVVDPDPSAGSANGFPATNGYLRLDIGDLSSHYESGSGVLIRLIVAAISSGVSEMSLTDVQVFDSAAGEYPLDSVVGATIKVGSPCP